MDDFVAATGAGMDQALHYLEVVRFPFYRRPARTCWSSSPIESLTLTLILTRTHRRSTATATAADRTAAAAARTTAAAAASRQLADGDLENAVQLFVEMGPVVLAGVSASTRCA